MPRRITKIEEMKADLQRYWDMLPGLHDYNDREFFMDGIINLDKRFPNIKQLDLKIAKPEMQWDIYVMVADSPYTPEAIANVCCIEPEDVRDFMDGEFPTTKMLKRIYLGLVQYGIK